jgi:hypothetical protein
MIKTIDHLWGMDKTIYQKALEIGRDQMAEGPVHSDFTPTPVGARLNEV